MNKFLIRWDKKAVEVLRKIDRKMAKRIIRKMIEVAVNPAHYLEPLKEVNAYKISVGDYRIIVELHENEKIIDVLFIGHRKNIYKNL